MLEVIKRDGHKVPFDKTKIVIAIEKAMNSSTGLYEEGMADRIADEIEEYAHKIGKTLTIYAIEDQVYYKLLEYHNPATARAYENYKLLSVKKIPPTKMYLAYWIAVTLLCSMKTPTKMQLSYPLSVT